MNEELHPEDFENYDYDSDWKWLNDEPDDVHDEDDYPAYDEETY